MLETKLMIAEQEDIDQAGSEVCVCFGGELSFLHLHTTTDVTAVDTTTFKSLPARQLNPESMTFFYALIIAKFYGNTEAEYKSPSFGGIKRLKDRIEPKCMSYNVCKWHC